jgi:hypothetical protein
MGLPRAKVPQILLQRRNCHILLPLGRNTLNPSPNTSKGLERLETNVIAKLLGKKILHIWLLQVYHHTYEKKLEGQIFACVNHVLQCAMDYENHARDGRSHSQFRKGSKEKE